MKGLCTKFGFAAMCSGVCMSMCALACFYLSAAGHTLMVCVCVCCFCSFHPCQILVRGIKVQPSQS